MGGEAHTTKVSFDPSLDQMVMAPLLGVLVHRWLDMACEIFGMSHEALRRRSRVSAAI